MILTKDGITYDTKDFHDIRRLKAIGYEDVTPKPKAKKPKTNKPVTATKKQAKDK